MATTLAQIQQQQAAEQAIVPGFGSAAGFELLQRLTNVFNKSSMVPEIFRGTNNFGNAVIAVEMAMRMNASPLLVMQNLYVVHGRPAWSAQFLIATFNSSGKYSPIRYEQYGKEGSDDWGFKAVATDLASGEKLEGPLITVGLAKKNGWYSKKDRFGNETSKWPVMTEQMLRYRAASWFIRSTAPEIAMGIQTEEEVRDETIELQATSDGSFEPVQTTEEVVQEHVEAKPATRRGRKPKAQPVQDVQPSPVQEQPAQVVQPAPQPMPEPEPVYEQPMPDTEPESIYTQPAPEDPAPVVHRNPPVDHPLKPAPAVDIDKLSPPELHEVFMARCREAGVNGHQAKDCFAKEFPGATERDAMLAMLKDDQMLADIVNEVAKNPDMYDAG